MKDYWIGINNPGDFVETTLDDDADEFIVANVYKNTSFVKVIIEIKL